MTIEQFCKALATVVKEQGGSWVKQANGNIRCAGRCPLHYFLLNHGVDIDRAGGLTQEMLRNFHMSPKDTWIIMASADDRVYPSGMVRNWGGSPDPKVRAALLEAVGLK